MSSHFNNPRLNSVELRKLIPIFVSEITEDLNAFEAAFNSADYKFSLEVLHKIKGSALSFGITALEEKAKELLGLIRLEKLQHAFKELISLKLLIRELSEESKKIA